MLVRKNAVSFSFCLGTHAGIWNPSRLLLPSTDDLSMSLCIRPDGVALNTGNANYDTAA